MGWEEVKVHMSERVRDLMVERAVPDDYLKQVIHQAETTGFKLYKPEANRYLSRSRLGEVTVYVEYSIDEDGDYTAHTAYWHRSKVGKD